MSKLRLLALAVAVAVLVIWVPARQRLGRGVFYVLFAFSVTTSVQLVGVYLVFASLIIPALAVRKAGKKGLWIAYGLGAAGYGLGLLLSAMLDMPAGAMIVLTLACIAMLYPVFITAPRA